MNRGHWIGLLSVAVILVGLPGGSALADETVSIGGSRAVLIKPNAPRASVILMPGGGGVIAAGDHGDIHGLNFNQLFGRDRPMRREGWRCSWSMRARRWTPRFNTWRRSSARSRSSLPVAVPRAAEGIARGARPDALVLTSGLLSAESGSGQNVVSILGSPASLPRTLVIHHREDSCRSTLPAGVEPFVKWSAGRARAVWVSGGVSEGDPCEAGAHHGFNGIDGQVVGIAAGFH
jgi:hypothetical protein